jgi:hypothetical protein
MNRRVRRVRQLWQEELKRRETNRKRGKGEVVKGYLKRRKIQVSMAL